MTEKERAAALADIEALVMLVEADCESPATASHPDSDSVGWSGDGMPLPMTFGHIRRARAALAALRTFARPAPADLREAIAEAIYSVSPWVYLDGKTVPWSDTPANRAHQETAFKAADAVLSLLPQTQTQTQVRDELTRPIPGIENRTAQEVFDMMRGRIGHFFRAAGKEG